MSSSLLVFSSEQPETACVSDVDHFLLVRQKVPTSMWRMDPCNSALLTAHSSTTQAPRWDWQSRNQISGPGHSRESGTQHEVIAVGEGVTWQRRRTCTVLFVKLETAHKSRAEEHPAKRIVRRPQLFTAQGASGADGPAAAWTEHRDADDAARSGGRDQERCRGCSG